MNSMNLQPIEKTDEINPDSDFRLVIQHEFCRVENSPKKILYRRTAISFMFLKISGHNSAFLFSWSPTQGGKVNSLGNFRGRLLSVSQFPGKAFLVDDL